MDYLVQIREARETPFDKIWRMIRGVKTPEEALLKALERELAEIPGTTCWGFVGPAFGGPRTIFSMPRVLHGFTVQFEGKEATNG